MGSFRSVKILVGIPAHNEERAIAAVVAGALPSASQVVVVDDGSTDLTAFNAHEAGAIIIRHKHNQGKGVAVATLFEYARQEGADVLVLIDGDGQHDPAEIPTLIEPCLNGQADVVVGSRYLSIHSEIPFDRSIGQRLFNVLTAVASGVTCSDSQSGFRAFNRRALCAMQISETAFSVECEQQFECRAHGLRLVEVPISCSYAPPAKRSPYRHGMQVLTRLGAMAIRHRLGPASQAAPILVTHDAIETFPGYPVAAEHDPLALAIGD
jgi:glycosyltransferase involved in cell wall biosynthesis